MIACKKAIQREPKYTIIEYQKALALDLSTWDSLELLIPQIGCESCIDQLIEQYQENVLKTKLSMIGVSREKDLRLNYGMEFVNNPNVKIFSEPKHKYITQHCFGLPSLLLYNEGNIRYFCFKKDEVGNLMTYLSDYEKTQLNL